MEVQNGIKIGGAEIHRSCHACAFFHSREEFYEILLPFIKDGILAGEKAMHILDSPEHASHMQKLLTIGISDAEKNSGQFEIQSWENAYLKPGHFSQDGMLEMLEDTLKEIKSQGYPTSRIVGTMEWACKEDVPGVKDLVKYEARLNHLVPKYDGVVVCTYDLSKHGASVIMDVLRTHPYVLIGGMMHENPYYTDPEVLMKELERREA